MAVTVSLSTLMQLAGLAIVAYAIYYIYYLFFTKPLAFQKYWRDQGVGGECAMHKRPLLRAQNETSAPAR